MGAVQVAQRSRVTSEDLRVDAARPESWIERRHESLRALRGRQVFRAEAGGRRVVVKEYAPGPFRRLLRSCAADEGERALEAGRRGVPCVEPLAWATLPDGREILLLRDEEGAVALRDLLLSGALTGARRHALAREVGALLARMQNAGIRHADLHAGNLLVRPDGTALLADARGFRFGPYLRIRQRSKDLAAFALFFLTHASRVDLLNFWGAYARASGFLPEEIDAVRRGALDGVPAAFRRVARKRTEKWRRAGRPVRTGGLFGIASPAISDGELEAIVAESLAMREGASLLKRSRTAWTSAHGGFVAKLYLPKKATRPLRDFLFGTRPERALLASQALRHRGIDTAEVAAVLKDGRFPSRSMLVMRRLEAPPFGATLRALPPLDARRTVARLGRLLRRMHDFGLRHRDLKETNLRLGADGRGIHVIDLDGVRQMRRVDWTRRARDLGHLAGSLEGVPTTLLLRGLGAYLGSDLHPAFARAVVAEAKKARRS